MHMAGPFHDVAFVVVDVETTGIRAAEDRIIEVAVLEVDGNRTERQRWSTLVRPTDRPLEGRLTALVDAPDFGDIAGDLCEHLSTAIVVGHNVKFDLRMIDAELERLGHALPELTFLDTHAVATKLDVDTSNRSLAVLCAALEVPFTSWHTAEGDVGATAALLNKLLQRAAGWGRTDLNALCGTWYGTTDRWPAIPATGLTLRRDPSTFPPGGPQPGTASAFNASWRRYGTGEQPYTPPSDNPMTLTIELADYDDLVAKTTIAKVTELIDAAPTNEWPATWEPEWAEAADYIAAGLDDTGEAALFLGTSLQAGYHRQRSSGPAGEARTDWYAGDFHAQAGIARLEHILATLDPSDEEDVVILVEASGALADLYRRHGGRHNDVVKTYNRVLDFATSPNAPAREEHEEDSTYGPVGTALNNVVLEWWAFIHKTRDVDAIDALHQQLQPVKDRLEPYQQPSALAAASVGQYVQSGEIVVAANLYRALMAHGEYDCSGLANACERLADAYAKAGRTDEAISICDQAWQERFADQQLANRHSLILERAGDYSHAADVARRGLQLADTRHRDALTKRIDRCIRKSLPAPPRTPT
jgi:DNA polymerase III epsilon subunit-like protein/tetratricopeptide (TPR) repeat protein